jgi:hypothetical protein
MSASSKLDALITADRFEKLKFTPRELELILLRAEGLMQYQIAESLHISLSNVKKIMRSVHRKLGVPAPSSGESDAETYTEYDRMRVIEEYARWWKQKQGSAKQEATRNKANTSPTETGDARRTSATDSDRIADSETTEVGEALTVSEEVSLLWDEFGLIHRKISQSPPAIRSLPAITPHGEYALPDSTGQARSRHSLRLQAIGLIALVAIVGGILGSLFTTQVLGYAQSLSPALPSTPTVEATSVPDATVSIVPSHISICGEVGPIESEVVPEFRPSENVILYTRENSNGAVLGNAVRKLNINSQGLWVGYASSGEEASGGLGFFNKAHWISCNQTPGITDRHINDIEITEDGTIWVAADPFGVSMYEEGVWQTFTTEDGLPDNATYDITLDRHGQVWVATYEGVAVFEGKNWSVPYSVVNQTLFNNHAHSIAFDSQDNIWVGHIDAGISRYDAASGQWLHHTDDRLGSLTVRDIFVREATDEHPESVWIATDGGGVSQYESGEWRRYGVEDGLPSDKVIGLAVDRYDRIWAATAAGVTYFDGERWDLYHHLPATDVAIGPACEGCPIDDDQIWTATFNDGLTYSRLPLDDGGVDVINVSHPKVLAPGENFRPEFTVAPRSPYQLREDRGDQLVHVDQDEFYRFGAHTHMKVTGTVQPGEPFVFTDRNTLFRAPELAPGEEEKTFTSTWRVWMHTRFVGPPIEVTFTVRNPE